MADVKAVRLLEDIYTRVADLVRDIMSTIPTPVRVINIPLVLGSRGVALAVGDHIFFRLGLDGLVTILNWSLAGTVSGASALGTITLDILIGDTMLTLTTIIATTTERPLLTAAREAVEQPPGASWTTQITDPQWIMAKVTSTGGTLEEVSLTLRCKVDS
jgi:hypothetical protein